MCNLTREGLARHAEAAGTSALSISRRSRRGALDQIKGLGLVASLVLVVALQSPTATATDFAAISNRLNELTQTANYSEALVLAEEFSARAREAFGAESVEFAATLMRKGAVLHLSGQVGLAGPLFEEALRIYQLKLPPQHPDVAAALNNLGMYSHWRGDYTEALDYYKRSLTIREQVSPPMPAMVAESLNNLAHTYQYLGRPKEAVALLERAMKLQQAPGEKPTASLAQALQNLASAKESMGDFSGAGADLRRATTIYAATLASDHPLAISALNRLALNLYLQRRFQDAEPIFREALARQRGSQQRLLLGAVLTDFAINQIHLGNLDEAEPLLMEALELRVQLLRSGHADIARTLSELAEISFQRGDLDFALERIERAAEIAVRLTAIDDRIRLIFYRYLKIGWRVYELKKLQGGDKLLRKAFLYSQRATQTQTAATVARMGARFASSDPALQDALKRAQDLETQQQQLESVLVGALAQSPAQRKATDRKARKQLAKIEKQYAALNTEISRRFPEYANMTRPEPAGAEVVRAALKPDEALVSLTVGAEETHVFAVTRDDVRWHRSAHGKQEIGGWVEELRDGVTAIGRLEKEPDAKLYNLGLAHDVYDRLLGEAEPVLQGKSTLLLIANGPLTSLPPQILVKSAPSNPQPDISTMADYANADWLIRHHAIAVFPAVNNLTSLRSADVRKSDRRLPMIGFGNPVFGNRKVAATTGRTLVRSPLASATPRQVAQVPSSDFASVWRGSTVDTTVLRQALLPLPDTEQELRDVARSVGAGNQHLRLRESATEKAVKTSNLKDYRIVYFATHGLVAGELAGLGEPALALSIPKNPDQVDDGLLTVSEIAFLDMDAEWVVLSACNTAAAGAPGAEGLSGLARAFFHAGARSMLVSHWPVYSDDTTALMKHLFEAQSQDRSVTRAAALRLAMLAHINQEGPLSAYPTFWAPFILVGETAANVPPVP